MDGAVEQPEVVPLSEEQAAGPRPIPLAYPAALPAAPASVPAARLILEVLGLSALVWLAAEVGLLIQFDNLLSPFWPPMAVLLAVILVAPRNRLPWYVLALLPVKTFLALRGGLSPWITVLLLAANCAEVAVPAYLLRRSSGRPVALSSVREVVRFILLAAVLAPPIKASIAVPALWWATGAQGSPWVMWRDSFLSELVAYLILIPPILTAFGQGWRQRWPRVLRDWPLLLEAVVVWVLVLTTSIVAFAQADEAREYLSPALYLPIPFLLWAAVRLGSAGVSVGLLTLTAVAIGHGARHAGPFGEGVAHNVVSLQLFLVTLALPLLLLAALVRERQAAADAARAGEERYRDVVESQTELVCRFLPDLTLTFVNEAYCRYFNRPREQLVGASLLSLLPQHAHRPALEYVRSMISSRDAKAVEHEVLRPDGTLGWHEWIDRPIFDRDGTLVEFQGIGRDVTQRKQSQAALRESTERVRELAARLIDAQEAERTRIAMELHDGVGQRLAAHSMGLSAMKRHLGQDGLEQLGRLQKSAHVLANEIRSLSHELHPGSLRHVGLVAALRATCRELDGKNGVSVTLAGGDDLPALSPALSLCLYRVAQEALHNVVQHARARHASLILARQDGRLRMTVCDDGQGFDPADARASDGVGLISMEERVRMMHGTIEIDTRPQRGTEVRVEIPLEEART